MIYYPTVFLNDSNERHIVKNQNQCECGKRYNVFPTFTQHDLKKIQFKPSKEVDCPQCRSIIS